jgi:hypothetical protein
MIIGKVGLLSICRNVSGHLSLRGRSNLAKFMIGAHRTLKLSEQYGHDPKTAAFGAQRD